VWLLTWLQAQLLVIAVLHHHPDEFAGIGEIRPTIAVPANGQKAPVEPASACLACRIARQGSISAGHLPTTHFLLADVGAASGLPASHYSPALLPIPSGRDPPAFVPSSC
jgi:hypothetical protein